MLSVSLRMDKIEYCEIIKFFVKEGFRPNEILSKFIKVYADSFHLFSTIKKWAAKFKCSNTSLEDDPREGLPISAAPTEVIEQVHDMVLDDRWMKVCEIAETIGISKKSLGYRREIPMKTLNIFYLIIY
jgi:hypothetical protein